MAKLSNLDQVSRHIEELEPALGAFVNEIKTFILEIDPEISKHIKWNSVSFYFSGDMKPFDPKEYKKDLLVINLNRGNILLVFPTGAKIKNVDSLLEGTFKDSRKTLSIKDPEDFDSKKERLKLAIQGWIMQVER
jgi:hypothetical protein